VDNRKIMAGARVTEKKGPCVRPYRNGESAASREMAKLSCSKTEFKMTGSRRPLRARAGPHKNNRRRRWRRRSRTARSKRGKRRLRPNSFGVPRRPGGFRRPNGRRLLRASSRCAQRCGRQVIEASSARSFSQGKHFPVMPQRPYSLESVRARPVTAARIEFERSRTMHGCLTADGL